jgi:hypothetical protein
MPKWLFMTVGMTVFLVLYAALRIYISRDARRRWMQRQAENDQARADDSGSVPKAQTDPTVDK